MGRNDNENLVIYRNTERCLGSMENQLSSSRIFPRAYNIADSPKDSRQNCKPVKRVQKNLKIEPSSCPCSAILTGHRKSPRVSLEFREGPKITQIGLRLDIGHFSVQEKKTNGMERTTTNLTECGI